jgi:hypothetical protein
MKYLLTVFIAHNKQELFVKSVAQEISSICNKSGVKYFYSEQSAIFTFETKNSFVDTKNFFDSILGDLSITHILVPIKTDKMSYWFEKEHEKLLFGTDICKENEEFTKEEQDEFRDAMLAGIDEMKISQPKKIIPTLDELLDKINVSGMKSLTNEEKNLLNQYSN